MDIVGFMVGGYMRLGNKYSVLGNSVVSDIVAVAVAVVVL